jgi:hypothetical protein
LLWKNRFHTRSYTHMIAVLISLVCLASTPLLSADASFSSMNVQILERLRFVQPREREKRDGLKWWTINSQFDSTRDWLSMSSLMKSPWHLQDVAPHEPKRHGRYGNRDTRESNPNRSEQAFHVVFLGWMEKKSLHSCYGK